MKHKKVLNNIEYTITEIRKLFDKMDCGRDYCYMNEKRKCKIYRECQMLDLVLTALEEKI